MDALERRGTVLSWFLRIALVAMAAGFAYKADWILVASSVVALALSLVPTILERDVGVTTPWLLDLLITFLLFLHMWGLYANAYRWVPFYDKVLHASASALLAFLATLLVYTVDRYVEGIRIVSYPGLAFVIFLFTLALGALWEIGEFTSDTFLGTHNQANNLDTMMDLVSDAIAGLLTAVAAAWAAHEGLLDDMAAEVGVGMVHAGTGEDEGRGGTTHAQGGSGSREGPRAP